MMRLLLTIGLALAAMLPACGVVVGTNTQLFVDDYLIESITGARPVLNPAVKVENNPVLAPERPWEGNTLSIQLVYFDAQEGQFKMRYSTTDLKARRQGDKTVFVGYDIPSDIGYTCLAVSEDGIHWERPELGLVEFQGSRKNNILPPSAVRHYAYIDYHDEDPSKRFKAHERIGTMSDHGMIFNQFTSADGWEWQRNPNNPIIEHNGKGRWGPTNFMGWDPGRAVYTVFMENCFHRHCPLGKRVIGRAVSPDGAHWSEPQTILVPDEKDPADLEFYELSAVPYEGMIMGLLWNFRTTMATHHPELVFSRDGVTFPRRYRRPFISRGGRGDFDHVSVFTVNPIVHGDDIYFYYYGRNARSLITLEELGEKAKGAIGLAMLPRDGMVSVDGPKDRYAELVTRDFRFSGKHLFLNLDGALQKAWSGGECDVRVEILGDKLEPLSGYRFKDADPIEGGSRTRLVTWQGDSDLSPLADRPIRLKIYFKNAKVYSFRIR